MSGVARSNPPPRGRAQIAGALVLALLAVVLTVRASRGEIQYGLDLQGGGRLVFELDGGGARDLERTCEVVRARLDGERIREASVRCHDGRIEVQVDAFDPSTLDRLARRLLDSHTLAFQKVDDETDVLSELVLPDGVSRQEESLSSPTHSTRALYLEASGDRAEERLKGVTSALALPPERKLVLGERRGSGPQAGGLRTYLLHDVIELGGESVADAKLVLDEIASPAVEVELDRAGAQKFEDLTGEMIGRRIAVVLDGRVLMAPLVMGKIGGGKLRISLDASGDLDEQLGEARELSTSLSAGALPRPVHLRETVAIPPAVGPGSVDRAVLIGVGLLVGFGAVMALRHRGGGALAAASPWLTLLLVAALYSTLVTQIGAVVTLPAVAGGVLFGGLTALTFAALAELLRRASLKPGSGAPQAPRRWWLAFGAAHLLLLFASAGLYAVTHGFWRGFSSGAVLGAAASLSTTLLLGSAAHARAMQPLTPAPSRSR